MRRGTGIAAIGLGVALMGTGCGEAVTGGPGTEINQAAPNADGSQGCMEGGTHTDMTEVTDRKKVAINDLSVDFDPISDVHVRDELTITAVGPESGPDEGVVTEIVFGGENLVFEYIGGKPREDEPGLPFDLEQDADNELRIDLEDIRGIRGGEDSSFTFQVREGDSEVDVRVESLEVGARVILSRTCEVLAPVVD